MTPTTWASGATVRDQRSGPNGPAWICAQLIQYSTQPDAAEAARMVLPGSVPNSFNWRDAGRAISWTVTAPDHMPEPFEDVLASTEASTDPQEVFAHSELPLHDNRW